MEPLKYTRSKNGTLIDGNGQQVCCELCGKPIVMEYVVLFGHVADWECYANQPARY